MGCKYWRISCYANMLGYDGSVRCDGLMGGYNERLIYDYTMGVILYGRSL